MKTDREKKVSEMIENRQREADSEIPIDRQREKRERKERRKREERERKQRGKREERATTRKRVACRPRKKRIGRWEEEKN